MDLLLDTHALLWFLAGDSSLSGDARQAFENPTNTKLVSAASLWEITIKHALGKLALHHSLKGIEDLFRHVFMERGFERLGIEPTHLVELASLKLYERDPNGSEHKDPFDRMLIVQSRVEQASIVTNETWWADTYGVTLIW